jgi:excisionase family DNA binding protein
MTDRDLYSIEEARQRLGGISRNTVYLWLRSGKLPSVVVGCRRFIAAAAIADLIAASTTITSPSQDSARARKADEPNLPLRISDGRRTR